MPLKQNVTLSGIERRLPQALIAVCHLGREDYRETGQWVGHRIGED